MFKVIYYSKIYNSNKQIKLSPVVERFISVFSKFNEIASAHLETNMAGIRTHKIKNQKNKNKEKNSNE